MCEGLVVPKAQNILLRGWHFLIFRYLIFQIQMLWISSVSTSCSENRVTQFSIWLLLRAQCYDTDIFESYIFHSFIFYIYLFCNDLISYHCLSYIFYFLNIILLAILTVSRHAPTWKHSYLLLLCLEHLSPRYFCGWLCWKLFSLPKGLI